MIISPKTEETLLAVVRTRLEYEKADEVYDETSRVNGQAYVRRNAAREAYDKAVGNHIECLKNEKPP